MADVLMKRVGPQGRISIPVAWRREWKSSEVMLIRRGNRIEITPIEALPPSSLFDTIKITADVDFTDPHSTKPS